VSAALSTLATELDAKDRELRHLSREVDRLATENGAQCDQIHALREENARLRALLGMADTDRPEVTR